MRLLADENFPKPAVDRLRADGHDVLWARTACPGWSDSDLLELAEVEMQVVLTLDKDFWQIALQRKTPLLQAGVVLFRVHPSTSENVAQLLEIFVQSGTQWLGHIYCYWGNVQTVPSQFPRIGGDH